MSGKWTLGLLGYVCVFSSFQDLRFPFKCMSLNFKPHSSLSRLSCFWSILGMTDNIRQFADLLKHQRRRKHRLDVGWLIHSEAEEGWLIRSNRSVHVPLKPDGASIQKYIRWFLFYSIFQDRVVDVRYGHGRLYDWVSAASLLPCLPSLVCLCLGSLCLALAPEPTHTSAPLPTPWTRCLKSSEGSASYAWEKGMSCVDKRRLSEPGRRRFLRLVSCVPMFNSDKCVCLRGLCRYTVQNCSA